MNSNHDFFRGQIQAWLSGQLNVADARQFEAHMTECHDCAAHAAADKELWEMLEEGNVLDFGPVPSAWPGVQERVFVPSKNGAWFFGGGQLMRASLAACALVAGLMVSALMPGLSPVATADEINNDLWVSEASWLDDSATDGLAGIWLDPGLPDESSGS